MPPKVKITKEDIIQTALTLVREGGEASLNARSIAAALNCSTQPVFSNFATMEELQKATVAAAYDCYVGFLVREVENGAYPKYKAFGRGYIRFAKEERALFKLLFMRDRGGEDLSPTPDFEASVDMIVAANGVTREQATRIHLEMWACTHGIATMIATSFFEPEWELISEMLSDVYKGLRARHALEEGKA
ncbi:MAG: TetR/AcrR family transcriptional regulator [Ruminococcaceae bacterium]|nr:TetR/AcrR family transcriptional regulator [Oscillospiraceae bacterium]